jgi:ABC-type phosphonate transport system ATPase subunit
MLAGMDPSQLRHLQLADLGEPELRDLIAAGETIAERKASLPADGLGPTIAAFANSDGGWVLLGVRDDGTVAGFQVPGKAEAQDWLRDKLRTAVDPLPPFASRTMTLDGLDVVVIRVEASKQAPHLVKATGAVYVREHGGRQPIATQARLLELCVRLEQAEQSAVGRMTSLPLVVQALGERELGEPVNQQTCVSDWMMVASPLAIPEGFRRSSLSKQTVDKMRAALLEQVRQLGPESSGVVAVKPHATGVTVNGHNIATGDGCDLLLDAGGVVVGHMRRRLTRGVWHVGQTADEVIRPVLDLTLGLLSDCGVVGKVLVHLYVRITPTAPEARPVLTVLTAHTSGELYAPPGSEAFFGGDALLPIEPEATRKLGEQLMHEIARASGIDWWESS